MPQLQNLLLVRGGYEVICSFVLWLKLIFYSLTIGALASGDGLQNESSQLLLVDYVRLEELSDKMKVIAKEAKSYFIRANEYRFFPQDESEYKKLDFSDINALDSAVFDMHVFAYSGIEQGQRFQVNYKDNSFCPIDIDPNEGDHFNKRVAKKVRKKIVFGIVDMVPSENDGAYHITFDDDKEENVAPADLDSMLEQYDEYKEDDENALLYNEEDEVEDDGDEEDLLNFHYKCDSDLDSDYESEEEEEEEEEGGFLNLNENDLRLMDDALHEAEEQADTKHFGEPKHSLYSKLVTNVQVLVRQTFGRVLPRKEASQRNLKRSANNDEFDEDGSSPEERQVLAVGLAYLNSCLDSQSIKIYDSKAERPEYDEVIAEYGSQIEESEWTRKMGWARRPEKGRMYGERYVDKYMQFIIEDFNQGAAKSSDKKSPAQMYQRIRDAHPDDYCVPGVTDCGQITSRLFSKEKDGTLEDYGGKDDSDDKNGKIPEKTVQELQALVEENPSLTGKRILELYKSRYKFPREFQNNVENRKLMTSKVGYLRQGLKKKRKRLLIEGYRPWMNDSFTVLWQVATCDASKLNTVSMSCCLQILYLNMINFE